MYAETLTEQFFRIVCENGCPTIRSPISDAHLFLNNAINVKISQIKFDFRCERHSNTAILTLTIIRYLKLADSTLQFSHRYWPFCMSTTFFLH